MPAFDTPALLFIAAKLAGVFRNNVEWDSLHQRPSSESNRVQQIPTNPDTTNDFVFANTYEFQRELYGAYDIVRLRNNLTSIGNALGFVDPLHPYALRRMVGNIAERDLNVPEMQRRQVMGHSAGDNVFEQNYLEKLPQLDVQQITRNLPEDRLFPQGISGYSARRMLLLTGYLYPRIPLPPDTILIHAMASSS